MNQSVLHLDWETRSACDLKARGLSVYAADPTTDVWLASYAFDDDEVKTWFPGQRLEDRLIHHIQSRLPVWAHNAPFEVAICNHVARIKHKWPGLDPSQMVCTMAMAYAMGLPGALEKAAAAVGIKNQKDMAGHRLMIQMASPREVRPDGHHIVWWDDSEKVQRLAVYGRQDVEVERELGKRLAQLSNNEKKVWLLDQRINQRGIHVDVKSIKLAEEIAEKEKVRLDAEMQKITEGRVSSCAAIGQIKDFLESNLVVVDGVAKNDVSELLSQEGLPVNCRTVLQLRKEAAKSSTKKLSAMRLRASSDNRVRGAHQYHGASTGRFAGRGIQIQNFPRGVYGRNDVKNIFDSLPNVQCGDYLNLTYGSPLSVLSKVLRSFITSSPQCILRWVDFSSIEARVIAWLAGEETLLRIFREGGDPYIHAASRIYGIDQKQVTKAQRQIGKVAVLALGYQGGKGAFQTMAKGYGVEVPDKEADSIKKAWRESHPNIVKYWYNLERGAIAAIRSKGEVITVGGVSAGRSVKYKKSGSFLWCQLPSERVICYPYPRVEPMTFKHPDTGVSTTKDGILYKGEDSKTGKWVDMKAYGGLLAENITQAVARDLLVEAMFRLERAGYPVVFHVHDEICVETQKNFGSLQEVERIAEIVPEWAKDLPIEAEGDEGDRYCK